MDKAEEELILSLIDQEGELKKYYQEHMDLEKRLNELQKKSFLSTEEELEKTRLKKLKLLGKDKIIQILDRHRDKKLRSAV
jgi:hypothetical protein